PSRTASYSLSLHNALPIWSPVSSTTAAEVSSQEVSMPRMSIFATTIRSVDDSECLRVRRTFEHPLQRLGVRRAENAALGDDAGEDRKSTRLNSSHVAMSYA